MSRHMHVSLFLLLLLFLFAQLYSTSGSVAAVTPQCMFDKMMKRGAGPSTGVVREVPRKGQGALQAYTVATENRKLIRIVTSTKDLENKKRYCSAEGMSIWDFNGGVITCQKYDVVTDENVLYIMNDVIPAAVKLHADRLLVDPVNGPLVVPDFEEDGVCSYFTVPTSHRCKGVENADMVLYVAAKPSSAFAIPCAKDNSGRPTVAAMNFRIHSKFGLRYSVRLAAHEIAHALGFDYQFFVDNNMVSTQNDLRGKSRTVVVSAQTKKKAQEHYGCNDLEGLELAYADEEGKVVASHWAHRVAKDELMSSYTVFGAGYYTALTMSVFDALPFYTANWGMEEPITWGNSSGCEFIRGNCITSGASVFPNVFCNGATSRCTSDRFAVGSCSSLDSFKGKNEMDECPFAKPAATDTPEGAMAAPCTITLSNNIPGSVTGSDSWCLDGESLIVKGTTSTGDKDVGGVCARVSCDGGVVKVQYAGNEEWHECPEGDSLDPSSTSSKFVSGKIKCPKYSEVCIIAPNGTSLLPLIVPPNDETITPPGTGSTGGGATGGEGTGGGAANVGNGNQGGDGCVAPALLAPVLLLVMALALLLHL